MGLFLHMGSAYPIKSVVKGILSSQDPSKLNDLKHRLPFFETWSGLRLLYSKNSGHRLFSQSVARSAEVILANAPSTAPSREIATEISWILGNCLLFRNEIRAYVDLRVAFGAGIMSGNLEKARLSLEEIERGLGVSLFSLERKFILTSEAGGYNKNKELLKEYHDSDTGSSFAGLAVTAYSLKNEGSVNYEYFRKLVEKNSQKINDPLSAEMIRLGIDSLSTPNLDLCSRVLCGFESAPIIDRYNLAVRVIRDIRRRPEMAKECKKIIPIVEAFLGIISDPLLANALDIYCPKAGVGMDPLKISYFQIFESKNIEDAGGQVALPIEDNVPLISFDWYHAVAISQLQNLAGDDFSNHIQQKILSGITDFYLGLRDFASLFKDFDRPSIKFSDSSLGACCRRFCAMISGADNLEEYDPYVRNPCPMRFSELKVGELRAFYFNNSITPPEGLIEALNARSEGVPLPYEFIWVIGIANPYQTEQIEEEIGFNETWDSLRKLEYAQPLVDRAISEKNGVAIYYLARIIIAQKLKLLQVHDIAKLMISISSVNKHFPAALGAHNGLKKYLCGDRSLRAMTVEVGIAALLLTDSDASSAEVVRCLLRICKLTKPSQLLVDVEGIGEMEGLILTRFASSVGVIARCPMVGVEISEYDRERRVLLKWRRDHGTAEDINAASEELVRIDKNEMIRSVLKSGQVGTLFVAKDLVRNLARSTLRDTYNKWLLLEEEVVIVSDGVPLVVEIKENPQQTRVELLHEIASTIYAIYLFDDDFGFDSLLSVKVRHNILPPLRAPFKKNKVVFQREAGGYILDDMLWVEDGHYLDEQARAALEAASFDVDKIIVEYRDQLIHIKRTQDAQNFSRVLAPELHPHGLFDFTPILKYLQDTWVVETKDILDFDDIFDQVYDVISAESQRLIEQVKATLAGDLRVRLEAVLDQLLNRAGLMVDSALGEALKNKIAGARSALVQSIQEISSWFSISDVNDSESFPLEAVVEAPIRSASRYFSGREDAVEYTCEVNQVISAEAASCLYDVVLTLGWNMFERSGGDELRAVSVSQDADFMFIEFRNRVSKEGLLEGPLEIAQDLLEAARIGAGGAKMRQEGRTGLVKSYRILRQRLYQDDGCLAVRIEGDCFITQLRLSSSTFN